MSQGQKSDRPSWGSCSRGFPCRCVLKRILVSLPGRCGRQVDRLTASGRRDPTAGRPGADSYYVGAGSRLLASCGGAALADWTAGSAAPMTSPPPANYRETPVAVACGPWTAASSVAVVASPCVPGPVGL